MNKKQLEDSIVIWMTIAIALGIIMTTLVIITNYFPKETRIYYLGLDDGYERGFQDGYTNSYKEIIEEYNNFCNENSTYDRVVFSHNNSVAVLTYDRKLCPQPVQPIIYYCLNLTSGEVFATYGSCFDKINQTDVKR